jgi:phage terminase small subunit
MRGKLTAKQRLFVQAFLGPAMGNATKAALMAGVPKTSASTMGYKWLRKGQVQRALVQRQEREERREILSADERDRILSTMADDQQRDDVVRQRAIDLLNKCEGRYSITHVLKGRTTVEHVIALSRRLPPAKGEK